MLSLQQCREILNQYRGQYSEEEILLIKQLLYFYATIEFHNYLNDEVTVDNTSVQTYYEDSS